MVAHWAGTARGITRETCSAEEPHYELTRSDHSEHEGKLITLINANPSDHSDQGTSYLINHSHVHLVRVYVIIGIVAWELSSQITRRLLFHRWESLAGGTEKGPLRLCGGGVPDHPSSGKNRSGKNQGELRINQLQLTLAHPNPGLRTKKEISCAQIRRIKPSCFFNVSSRPSPPRGTLHVPALVPQIHHAAIDLAQDEVR